MKNILSLFSLLFILKLVSGTVLESFSITNSDPGTNVSCLMVQTINASFACPNACPNFCQTEMPAANVIAKYDKGTRLCECFDAVGYCYWMDDKPDNRFIYFLPVSLMAEGARMEPCDTLCDDPFDGWDTPFTYKANSGIDPFEAIHNVMLDKAKGAHQIRTDGTTVSSDFHDHLFNASEILLVVFDTNGRNRVEVKFRGVNDIWDWFAPENIIKSSLWNISSNSFFEVFELGHFEDRGFNFEIGAQTSTDCNSTGFFKISCQTDQPCRNLRWWRDGLSDLQYYPCGILYSQSKNPVAYDEAFWASEIRILTKPGSPNGAWQKVLWIKSFAGLISYHYYYHGLHVNPDNRGKFYTHKAYRHINFQEKIMNAEKIRFRVFAANETTVVSELVFTGTHNFMNWFSKNNIESSSLWNFTSMPDEGNGVIFAINWGSNTRYFFINRKFGGCDVDEGWFAIISRTTLQNPQCSWEKWWIQENGGYDKRQPPYILYSPVSDHIHNTDFLLGAKIDISVK